MNTIDIEDIQGILNCVAQSRSFFDEYEQIEFRSIAKLIGNGNTDINYAVLKSFSGKSICVRISDIAFANLQSFARPRAAYSIPQMAATYASVCNMFGVNNIMAFSGEVFSELYRTHLLCESDGIFYCRSIRMTDAILLSLFVNFPIFLKKDVAQAMGLSDSELQKKLEVGEELENDKEK